MSGIPEVPWAHGPAPCFVHDEQIDYPAMCEHCGDEERTCECACCNLDDGEHLCIACCIAVGCNEGCGSVREASKDAAA